MQEEAPEIEYLCGTMIELPRAALRADEIAEHADFFSFGTNDLTQTTLGMSRDDAEGKFLTFYLEEGVLESNPFETLDQSGVGDLMQIGVERGRSTKPEIKLGICGEHGGEPRSVEFCHGLGIDYVSCSPVPRAARTARSGAGRAERRQPSAVRRRRRLMARYVLLVDGDARGKAGSDDDARAWIRGLPHGARGGRSRRDARAGATALALLVAHRRLARARATTSSTA